MRSTRAWPRAALFLALAVAGCSTPSMRTEVAAIATPSLAPTTRAETRVELGRNAAAIVRIVQPGDTRALLAERILGDASQATRIVPLDRGEANSDALRPGAAVAIALGSGFAANGPADVARRVPVLCYHRFTPAKHGTKMEVAAADFERQLQYLHDQGYTVVPLSRLMGFLDGGDLPAKAVVLTIDDGYRSAYTVAYPLLRAYAAPATLFVYSDFIGAGGAALTWAQLGELRDSKLVDIQAHSKTHTDMTQRLRGETDAAYQRRLVQELNTSRERLKTRVGVEASAFAYPYGAANSTVLSQMRGNGWTLGLTVLRGGNPSWTDPLLLRRDMIYGTDTLEQFARKLAAAETAGRAW